MTTPTPTSEGAGAAAPSVGAAQTPPPGLLNEATLARLANEFFSALPGAAALAVPAAGYTGPATAPSSPQAASAQAPGAGMQPAAPSPAATTPPRVPFSESLSTPPAFGTAIPAVGTDIPRFGAVPPELPGAPASPPSTPYYFLGEASGYPSVLQQAQPPAGADPLVPQSFGLPGQAEVLRLLDSIFAAETAAPKPAAAGNYYFIDPAAEKTAAAEAPPLPQAGHPPFDVHAVRRDFPILAERVNGQPLIWLDNAATTQKPQAVIDRLAHFYAHENSNIHRAAHELAARATDAYESARNKVARFLGAGSAEEIVFVRGATEGINLVAQAWGKQNLKPGDEILLTWLEHHANIVPWQQIAAETGAKLRVAPVDDDGQVLLDEFQKLLGARTRIAAFTQVSNALGTVTPVREMAAMAHRAGACVLVDGAQAVSHMRVNVQALGADFYVFSGHKLFAPTGIGVVYGRSELLNAMPPWQGGGNMIQDVTFEKTSYQKAPTRFEAGTGNIADAVGLGAAIDYLERLGLENVAHYEHGLLEYATQGLRSVPGLRLIGTAKDKASVLSFTLKGYRPEEVGAALNREGIAVRAGHHCAQPILRRFGVEATVRPSLAFYNTCQEIDTLVAALLRLARAQR